VCQPWETRQVVTGFRCGNLRERDCVEDKDVEERIILQNIFRKWFGEAWIGLIWLGIETGDGFFVNAMTNLRVP
jgi:hypothetical protein